MAENDISKYDKALAVTNETLDGMDWYSVDSQNVELNGLCFRKPGECLRRIPLDTTISPGVDHLSWSLAGVMLRFKTDSREIRVHAKVGHTNRVGHMAHIGIMGFDLYVGSGSSKFYAGSFRFDFNQDEYNVKVDCPFPEQKIREYTINFPLYSGLEYFRFGVTAGSTVELPTPWKDPRPVVVYGTSIQQCIGVNSFFQPFCSVQAFCSFPCTVNTRSFIRRYKNSKIFLFGIIHFFTT